mmetsp:Transcript_172654/g.553301  ORF Transcript_172654/g.553301 Transcript_172654/m.553301 type:complete len:236 (+) Transcript_172654:616-1323(+)
MRAGASRCLGAAGTEADHPWQTRVPVPAQVAATSAGSCWRRRALPQRCHQCHRRDRGADPTQNSQPRPSSAPGAATSPRRRRGRRWTSARAVRRSCADPSRRRGRSRARSRAVPAAPTGQDDPPGSAAGCADSLQRCADVASSRGSPWAPARRRARPRRRCRAGARAGSYGRSSLCRAGRCSLAPRRGPSRAAPPQPETLGAPAQPRRGHRAPVPGWCHAAWQSQPAVPSAEAMS